MFHYVPASLYSHFLTCIPYNVQWIRSGHLSKLPFHTCSTQQEIVHVRRVLTYWKCCLVKVRRALQKSECFSFSLTTAAAGNQRPLLPSKITTLVLFSPGLIAMATHLTCAGAEINSLKNDAPMHALQASNLNYNSTEYGKILAIYHNLGLHMFVFTQYTGNEHWPQSASEAERRMCSESTQQNKR